MIDPASQALSSGSQIGKDISRPVARRALPWGLFTAR